MKTLRVKPGDLPLIVELIPESGVTKQYLLKIGGRRLGLLLNASEPPDFKTLVKKIAAKKE